MNDLFADVASRFERTAIAAAERFVVADDALRAVAPGHEHHATAKTQHETARQLMFDAFSDLEFVRRTTSA
jgi:hypothetical protein